MLAAAGITIDSQPAATSQRAPVTKAQADRWMTELSNEGRWGQGRSARRVESGDAAEAPAGDGAREDRHRRLARAPGRARPETRRDKGGRQTARHRVLRNPVQDLSRRRPARQPRVQQRRPGVPRPRRHDAPRRALPRKHQRKLYNGFPLKDTVSEETGCTKLGLDNLKDGIVTRGILIDMTRLKSAASRAPGSPVYPDDIEAWERQAGLKVSSGDALFVYNTSAPGRQGAGPWRPAHGPRRQWRIRSRSFRG